ncbi:MAG: hypothetical protein ACPGVV_11250 [Croceimicrobium sp.]
MKFKTLGLAVLFAINYAFAGNPDLAKGAHSLQKHWQFGAGYGPSYARLGIQLKKTLPFMGKGRLGGWAALGINYLPTYAVGLDFYIVENLYLSLGFGTVGTYERLGIDRASATLPLTYYTRSGYTGTLNYDIFFNKNWGLKVGLGYSLASYTEDVSPILQQFNLGLIYAFEEF